MWKKKLMEWLKFQKNVKYWWINRRFRKKLHFEEKYNFY